MLARLKELVGFWVEIYLQGGRVISGTLDRDEKGYFLLSVSSAVEQAIYFDLTTICAINVRREGKL